MSEFIVFFVFRGVVVFWFFRKLLVYLGEVLVFLRLLGGRVLVGLGVGLV